ncbi:MAG: amino acid permease [Bacteroidales bacterium]
MISKDKIIKVGVVTATSFVIANMVGTGVFTSLGYQLAGTKTIFSIMLLWVIGGVFALCGSLVYGELGAAMPRSGGEYHYLSKIYHPIIGFVSGFISITIGFAAPVAAACIALGSYTTSVFPELSSLCIALSVLIIITGIHSYDIRIGSGFQNVFTLFKILLIIIFVICGFILIDVHREINLLPSSDSWKDIINPVFAVSLVFVSYAYSGWNASAYIAGEMDKPQKKLPQSLLRGTLIVTVLYFLLNYIFLYTTPVSELIGHKEIGYISANHIFGLTGGKIMGMLISILLISSISSMVFVGPRVNQVMGEDYSLLKFLSKKNKRGIPLIAILFQSLISLILIISASFETIIVYVGFTLNIFTFLTVLGIFVHRYKFKDIERPYKTWGYPVVPIIFLLLMLWIFIGLMIVRPIESLLGFATVLSGLLFYFVCKYYSKKEITIAR